MKMLRRLLIVSAGIGVSHTAFAQMLVIRDDVPAEFIDISSTGEVFDPTDDGFFDHATTISNALFPAGVWRVGNNGGMGLGATGMSTLLPAPGFPISLPSPLVFGGVAQSILPGWDDEGDDIGHVYWQEFADKLIVQWDRNVNPGTMNTTSFQAIIPAGNPLRCGIYAQFIYRDVQQLPRPDFGRIFTIGYQDGETGQHNSVTYQPRPINNNTVLTLTCVRPGCVGDVDDGSGTGTPDGGVTLDDLLFYLLLFDAGDSRADVDNGSGFGFPDGGIGIEDLLYFLFRFDRGC